MNKEKLTICENSKSEYEIKKSKFIAFAFLLTSIEDAKKNLAEIKETYSDATHVCYAFSVVCDGVCEKCDDDGEPSGTAGKPILEMIKKKNLVNVLIVVIRYFGGIKLGAGGLLRAYATSAKQVIETAGTQKFVSYVELCLTYDYSEQTTINNLISSYGAMVLVTEFETQIKQKLKVNSENKEVFSKWTK